jgi:hypothetical protein
MKYALFVALLLIPASALVAQEKAKADTVLGWTNEVVGSLNLSQTSFDNWSQGGENSLSWQLNANAKFVNDRENYNWSNAGKISLGAVKVGDQETKKSVDEIRLESVLTYKITRILNPYIAATGETQFAKGYDYSTDPKLEISKFMDPAFLTQSAGAGYAYGASFKTRLGAALKETITKDHRQYSDNPDTPKKMEKSRVEVGVEFATDFSQKVAENMLLTSKLELFSNLESFQEVDVKWDTILSAKVAQYVDVNLNVKLFYDRDISRKRQLKQALALGLTYTFL